ncbi:MAG: hypothetical protein IJ530_04395 [Treponema sp.]|uniref:hypothetical protein n=1 Tax=Treponema sp. TaxID=166 RepID=UPI0025EFF149|nr:hypothetical protein [Treponema sp.]MBQ8678985.1 hypothetical protein [Treponema sp.]
MERQKAFIATENYIKNTCLPFGVGVVTSFDEEDVMRCATRQKNLDTRNEWLDIRIPARDSFLNLDLPIGEQSKEILRPLFSQKALSLLFYADGQKYFQGISGIITSMTDFPEERSGTSWEELGIFYEEKTRELEKLVSVYSLIQFITEKTRNRDMAITSSFLQVIGINGIIFSGDNAERALVFDAKNQIEVMHFNSEVL